MALEHSLPRAGIGAPSPEPGEVGMDAERGPVHLDALAVDLDDRSGGRHVLGMGPGRRVRARSSGVCHSSQPNPMPPPGRLGRWDCGLLGGAVPSLPSPLTEFSLYSG